MKDWMASTSSGRSLSQKWVCFMCGKSISTKDNLARHIRQHTDERPFGCHLCSQKCRQKAHLRSHLRRIHGIHDPKSSRSITVPKYVQSSIGGGAGLRQINSSLPQVRKATQQQQHEPIRQIPIVPDKSKRQRWKHSGSHRCEICQAKFQSEGKLEGHKRRHHFHNERPGGIGDSPSATTALSLPIPPQSVSGTRNTAEILRAEPTLPDLSLPVSYIFPQLNLTMNHEQHLLRFNGTQLGFPISEPTHTSHHPPPVPPPPPAPPSGHEESSSSSKTQQRFPCTECDRVLARKDSLDRHMLIHRNVKPFFCHVCGKEFRQKTHLQCHMRYHRESSIKLQQQQHQRIRQVPRHDTTNLVPSLPHLLGV